MKIGIVQFDIIWQRKEENKKKCEEYFIQAQKEDVDVLVFPEMTLTGFSVKEKEISEIVVEREGEKCSPTIDFFKNMTIKYKICAVFGFSEQGKEKLENKMMILEEGKLIYEYQKIHPFTFAEEEKLYGKGDKVSIANLKGHIVSGFICYDLRFPAIFQTVSKRAEMIFVIANWPEVREEHWLTLLKARAIENQCYMVGVNRIGSGGGICYSGKSTVVNAAGEELLVPTQREGLFVVEIDFEWQKKYRENFPTYLDRRDNLYSELHI